MSLPAAVESYAALALVLVATRHVLRHGSEDLRRVRERLTAWRLWPAPATPPDGPALEVLAADLRRLYPRAHHPLPGSGMPRQRGWLQAYDDRLLQTARALDVPTSLRDCPAEGFDRAAERIRLEDALSAAGLVWQLPTRGDCSAR